MKIAGSRVAVVGGSIAGCAAAIALGRAGCAVTVIERSSRLRDRGFGIGVPTPSYDEFVAAGYLDAHMPSLPCRDRVWIVRDDADPRHGRTVWRHPFPTVMNNWGIVWRTLRDRVPDGITWRVATVTGAHHDRAGCAVTVDGRAERFDVVVGADGYRSVVRGLVAGSRPGHRPGYSGYSLWRGNFPMSRLASVPAELERDAATVAFTGGHGILYPIPGLTGPEPVLNWAIYAPTPVTPSFDGVSLLPPGSVGDALADRLDQVIDAGFPELWAEVVRTGRPSELALQPIADLTVDNYSRGHALLVGDAGAVARPHTGMGAVKAIQDAMFLERLCREDGDWDTVLAAYDQDRVASSTRTVELGRRLGRAQVERTPPWATMSWADYEAWWAAQFEA